MPIPRQVLKAQDLKKTFGPYQHPSIISLPKKGHNVCFVGDFGLGLPIQYKLAEILRKHPCHQIRAPGDIVYPRGIRRVTDKQLQKKFTRPFGKILKGEGAIPFFLSLGNHDHYGNAAAWKDVAKLKEFPHLHFPHYYYWEKWGDICFVQVDTHIPSLLFNKEKKLQEEWIKHFNQKERASCKVTIGVGHHPYKSARGLHGGASGSIKEFYQDHILKKFDFFIAGHDHQLSYEGEKKGTHLFISGAGTQTRSLYQVNKKKLGENYSLASTGYLVLRWDDASKQKGIFSFYTFKLSSEKSTKVWEKVFLFP